MTATHEENVVELLRLRRQWRERDHPRDGEGKFAERGGSYGRAVRRVGQFDAKVARYEAAKERYAKNGPAGVRADASDEEHERYRRKVMPGEHPDFDPEFSDRESQKSDDELIANGRRPTPGRRTQKAQGRVAVGPEGKYTRGQKVSITTKTKTGKERKLRGTIASAPDPGGNYTVHVDNGVNGRKAKYHHTQITPTETRNRARGRNAGAAGMFVGAVAANHYLQTGDTPMEVGRKIRDANRQRRVNRVFDDIARRGAVPGATNRPR